MHLMQCIVTYVSGSFKRNRVSPLLHGRLRRDTKGVATSLIEATATVAVGAVLAGVAVGGAIDAINDSKIQAAIGDEFTATGDDIVFRVK